MAFITDILNTIKNARKGKDMRQAIYDGIQQCYEDATGHPDSVAAVVERLKIEKGRIDELATSQTFTGNYTQSNLVFHAYRNATTGDPDPDDSYNYEGTSGKHEMPICKIFQEGTLDFAEKQSNEKVKILKEGLYIFELRIFISGSGKLDIEARINDVSQRYNAWQIVAQSTEETKIIAYILYLKGDDVVSFYGTPGLQASVRAPVSDVNCYVLDWIGKAQISDCSKEISDIRVGADGNTYPTAGEAIREQIGNLTEDIGSVICPYVKILNGDRTLKELHIPVRTKFRIETLNGENFGVTTTLRLLDSSKNEIDYYSIYKDTKYRDVVNNFDRDIYYVKLGGGDEINDGINDFRVVAYISDKLFTRVCKLESNEIALLQLQNAFNKMDAILIPNEYLRNGSISNALNEEVVATRLIFTKAKSIKVATDRPNTDGFVYVYSYATSSGICFDLDNNNNYRKGYIDYGEPPHYNDEYESWNDGENYGIQIAIGEYDITNKKYNQLRVTDFDGYKIYVFDTTAMKNSLRLKSTEERLDLIEKGYPAFYDSYIVDRIETVKSKDILIGNSGDSFVFITDMHDQNNYYSPFLAKKICDSTSVKRIIYGGDYENEPLSKESAVSLLTTRRNKCMVKDDVIFLRGNHDTNPYGKGTLTEAEFYSIFEKHIEKHINTNKNTYFYNDNESQKIRYFFVDSGVNGSISDVQKNWIKINAGNLNSDWTVIAFMHHGIYTDDKDDRTNIKVYPSLISVKEALANVSCKIACIICGHTHIDLSDTSGKYPVICTTCDAHGIQASSMSSDNRDANTINEQAFDVFHVDTVNQKVYATRIGGGKNDVREDKKFELNDREFSYS